MRLRLALESIDPAAILPFNYQYPLSAWLHQILNVEDNAIINELKRRGLPSLPKHFRAYTFSAIRLRGHKLIKNQGFALVEPKVELTLSLYLPMEMVDFVIGLFIHKRFALGHDGSRVRFAIQHVKALELPEWNGRMQLHTLSPISLLKDRNQTAEQVEFEYRNPADDGYAVAFIECLTVRYQRYCDGMAIEPETAPEMEEPNMMEIIKKPESKQMRFKDAEGKVLLLRGWLFDFELRLPPHLARFGYLAGFGDRTTSGLGCTVPIRSRVPASGE